MAKQPIRNKTETQITLKVPTYLPTTARADIANQVIDFIRERTLAGQNVYGRKWSGKAGRYTKEYAKIKGQKSPVDLELDGDMLAALRYFKSKSKSGEITIGYQSGTKQAGKAEGNIQGTYGQPSPIPGKARPFLDILKKDLNNIVADYVESVAEGKKDATNDEKRKGPEKVQP